MAKMNSSALKNAVERLSYSEERFRLLVESVQDYALFMLDPAGHVASWNQGAERMKGYSREEIVGRYFSQFYTREDIDRGKPDAALEAASTDGRFEDEGWRVRKDGSRFWASVVLTAMRDESGRLRGFGKVTRDLTERNRAMQRIGESEARLQAFMNYSPSPMFIKNLDGHYQYANNQFCRSFGLERDAVLGRSDAEIFSADQAAGFQANDASVIAAGAALEFEETAEYNDGRHVSIVCKFPIRDADGRIAALGGIVTDITGRVSRDARCAAPERRPGMDGPHGPMGAAYAVEKTTEGDVDALSQMISRDLRPPLRNIETLAKQVREGMAELNTMARRLDLLAQSASGLSRLANDLLMYSRSRRLHPAHRRTADLDAVCADVLRELSPVARSSRIQWKVGKLPRIAGDPALLRVVFEHLLSNAIKFTRRRDLALIEVSANTATDGGLVVVEIKDNGIGFSAKQAHRLFEPFQRLHGDSPFEGAGIGLATAKRIIDCHGGRIWASSQPGEGASFCFALQSAGQAAHPA